MEHVIEVELLSDGIDADTVRASLSTLDARVDVRHVEPVPQAAIEWLLPAVITIKTTWAVLAPYLSTAGSLLWRVGTDAVALAVLTRAAQEVRTLYKTARSSGFSWQSGKQKRATPQLRIEIQLPALPGVDGRRIVGILPDGLTDEQLTKATDTILEAFRQAEAKRLEEIQNAERVAALIKAGQEDDAMELHITSRETIRDWTFGYDPKLGWLEANTQLQQAADRALGRTR